MAEGRHLTFKKNKNHCFSATIQAFVVKFGRMVERPSLNPVVIWKLDFKKSKVTEGSHFKNLKNNKNRRFSEKVQAVAVKFGSMMVGQFWTPLVFENLKFYQSKLMQMRL